jgi:hypothetical protein
MFVKLSYGSQVLTSETVDARVSPRWTPTNYTSNPTEETASMLSNIKSIYGGPKSYAPGFRFSENDLHIQVEPQQTHGSIRLSVFAERLNAKNELGVIYIPLGAAIAACIDAAQGIDAMDYETIQGVPAYTRWFPLMDPRLANPVEGDMGLSSRPKECEQRRDNMFKQYFAPCIQLSLIWWPDEHIRNETVDDSDQASESKLPATNNPEPEQTLRIPAIQNYFNIDIGRASVALIDSQRAVELLNLSLMEIDVRHAVTRTKTRAGIVVGWIQLDHQDNRSREPVVLAPTPAEYIQPTIQFLAIKDNMRTKTNIVSYEYIGVALQELDFTVEESWIFELWDFLMSVTKRRKAKKQSAKGQRRENVVSRSENLFTAVDWEDDTKPSLFSIIEAVGNRNEATEKRKVYVEHLILGLMKVNLSYMKGKKQNLDLHSQGTKALKSLEMKELQNFALAAGGIQFGTISKTDQSEVFTKWSQLTNEEDTLGRAGGKSLRYVDLCDHTVRLVAAKPSFSSLFD